MTPRGTFGRRAGLFPVLAVVAVVAAVAAGGVAPAPAEAVAGSHRHGVTVVRGGPDARLTFAIRRDSEVLVDLTASAPGVSWGRAGAESAVMSVSVDGRYATDDVVMSAAPITRQFALGRLGRGRHTLRLHFAADRSPAAASSVRVSGVRLHQVGHNDPAYRELAHAPVFYGRDGTGVSPAYSGPYQNAFTDTPLVAWHEDLPAATAGHRVLMYSIVWSNEDGGTSTPALMARWGRTTDIEWIYQVEVDARGDAVPGTAVFQAPNHVTAPFTGRYEGDHPLLQTCTLNNNVCDTVSDPMRFALSTAGSLDAATDAREQVMDRNPWTYQVMAEEIRREGKVVAQPPPGTTELISDPRDYLYLVVRKQTTGPPNGIDWVGLSVGVRLAGDPTLYRSDQAQPSWSLQRDLPAATTVRLPPGTTAADIAEIDALRVPATATDTGATITVQAVNRAFFLGADDEPGASVFAAPVSATLTPAVPTAVLYRAAG